MVEINWKKELAHLYMPSAKAFSIVEVPEMSFLMIDGHGDPNTSKDYVDAISALYSAAYTLKFALKSRDIAYAVPALEGLWWVENMSEFSTTNKDAWDWTMMIMQPTPITPEFFTSSVETLSRKKDLPALSRLRLENYQEGLSAQILYYGAYADEGPTIAKMHEFIRDNGYSLRGKHHEIYLGDPRRVVPEKLKTIIRQPMQRTSG